MNRTAGRIPVGSAAAFAVACGLLAAALAGRRLWPLQPSRGSEEIASLRAELAELPADAELRLSEWRAQHQRAPAVDPLAAARETAGATWRIESRGGSSVIVARNPAATRWSEVTGLVDRLETVPGVAVLEITIESSGSRTAREFRRIEIVAGLPAIPSPLNPVRPPPPTAAGPGSGPLAAGLRETGPGALSAGRSPPPAATQEAGSGFRPGGASVPATLAPAAELSQPKPQP